jgi:hypothetical protein
VNFALALVAQLIAYSLLLLVSEYAGTLTALILGGISLAVWLLSYVVELIEPSRVSKQYYRILMSCWLAPLLALAAFIALRGRIGWL